MRLVKNMKTRNNKTFEGCALIFLFRFWVANADQKGREIERAASLNKGISSLGIVVHNGGDKGVALMRHIAEAFSYEFSIS